LQKEIAIKQGANALKDKWASLLEQRKKDMHNQIVFTLQITLLRSRFLSKDAEPYFSWLAKETRNPAFHGLFKPLKHLHRIRPCA